ncbi:MAG: hypothetical protein JNM27_06070 [Leptospirales bacterium]|nr:hypothetical protein [Leptospirales bacterium]
MKPVLILRIAAIVNLLYFAGHTSGIPWTPSTDAESLQIIEKMKLHSFDVSGSTRTYWDFYQGFGIIISVYLLGHTVALWLMSNLARANYGLARPFLALFLIETIVRSYLSWKFFFVVPLAMGIILAILLALSLARRPAAHPGQ